jgi:hypothetical protein
MRGWLALMALACLPAGVRADCCDDCYAKLITQDIDRTDLYNEVIYDCYQVYKCETPCGLGQQYRISCSSVTVTYGNTLSQNQLLCETCPSGKYRNNVQTQPACAACTTCQSNQKMTVECTATGNRQCQACGPGFIVVGKTECKECNSGTNPGTYANAAQTACVGCKNCGVFQRMTSDCSSTQDRQCANCGPNQRALSTNAGSCQGCNQFYVRGENGCAVCNGENAACLAGYWINCQFSDAIGGYRTCDVCMGQADVVAPGSNQLCAVGFGVAKRCTGKDTEKTMCVPCAKGTERGPDTPLVDEVYQGCAKCGTGKFKIDDGSALCGDCSNKPADNSRYDVWPSTQAASTATCPWYAILLKVAPCIIFDRCPVPAGYATPASLSLGPRASHVKPALTQRLPAQRSAARARTSLPRTRTTWIGWRSTFQTTMTAPGKPRPLQKRMSCTDWILYVPGSATSGTRSTGRRAECAWPGNTASSA